MFRKLGNLLPSSSQGTVSVTINAENEEKALKLAKKKVLNTDFGELENIQFDRPQKLSNQYHDKI